MSASAIAIGAALGLAIVAVLTAKVTTLYVAGKWALASIVLAWLFLKDLKAPEEPVTPPRPSLDTVLMERYGVGTDDELSEKLSSMTTDERIEAAQLIRSYLDASKADLDRSITSLNRHIVTTFSLAALLAVVGVALLLWHPER